MRDGRLLAPTRRGQPHPAHAMLCTRARVPGDQGALDPDTEGRGPAPARLHNARGGAADDGKFIERDNHAWSVEQHSFQTSAEVGRAPTRQAA